MSSEINTPYIGPDDKEPASDPLSNFTSLEEATVEERYRLRNRRVVRLFLPESPESPPQLLADGVESAVKIARVQGVSPEIVGFEKVVDEETGKVTQRIGQYGVQALFPGSRSRPS